MNPRTTWSIYEERTGLFTGHVIVSDSEATVRLNTPENCKALVGNYRHDTHRIDLTTGNVVEYTPEPDPQAAVDAARSTLQALDVRALRALSDLAVTPTNAEALLRVLEIEPLKEVQREIIRGSK
jgi:hypothetical protein